MSFKKPLPTWKAQGIQPPEHKLEEGWNAQDKPPAGWLNWQANTTYEALKELQENAVDHRDVTSEPSPNGVVRLNEAGRLNEAVFADAEHKEITLKPGVQIVESDQDTPFNVGSIKGRTLINLLGRWGGMESLTNIIPYNCTTTLDFESVDKGSFSVKITVKEGFASGAGFYSKFTFIAGKYYVGIAMIRVLDSEKARLNAPSLTTGNYVTSNDKFSPSVFTVSSLSSDITSNIDLGVSGGGKSAYFDSVRIYEITATEFEALTKMTPEQVAAKYPYVDSMTNVTNPYAIVTGDNLLPPFYEWEYLNSSLSSIAVRDKYEVMVSNSDASSGAGMRYYVKVKGGLAYKLSADPIEGDVEGGEVYAYGCDASKNRLTGKLTDTFTVDSNVSYIEVVCNSTKNGVAVVGTFIFRKPMLTVGTEAKPFKPQQRSMWAAECQLAANPVDGSNADVLFTGDDGLPYVLEKWGKEVLAENQQWGLVATYTGFKQLGGQTYSYPITGHQGLVVKYDGKPLPNFAGVPSGADMGTISQNSGEIHLTIANADSGWGDAYTPTIDEIKAYFLGWKMMNADDWSTPYNNVGTKGWYKFDRSGSLVSASGVKVLPTTMNDLTDPYRLQYLKATPTVEPVRNYETGLTLCAGSNVVEVGSGIVIREKANPTYYSPNGNYYINNTAVSGSLLKNKVSHILRAYRNGWFDNAAKIENDANAYGKQHVRFLQSDFDPTSVYHVTYTMLDPTLTAPINGTVATNLRGTVSDLVQRSGDVERRLSVSEVRLNSITSDLNSPLEWITATLINGWNSVAGRSIQYAMDVFGFVHFRGTLDSGGASKAVGTDIFVLPSQFRPSKTIGVSTVTYNSPQDIQPYAIDVGIGGSVRVTMENTRRYVYLESFSFYVGGGKV
ncbi:hypothetical protein [Paenibacillus sp. 1001270B_150601_E10]|uniref:hypothetical protein n=1 Tax=Paenibacillus sp. 1001270B_150601_E10 TaxID=2787079 RepID=UPI00189E9679|nr:hypothetical protein [Paenibacillus sp. 1001270B_150601_E10]